LYHHHPTTIGKELGEKEGEFYLGRVEERKREGKGEENWQIEKT